MMGRKMKPKGRKKNLTPNLALKVAILLTRRRQGVIARKAQIGEVRLSAIVCGRVQATPIEQVRLAKVLNRPVTDLFPTIPGPGEDPAAENGAVA
jgi:hypothetical protein